MSLLLRWLPLAALLLSHAATADSMRCGSALVSRGAHPAKVLLECGEPLYREHRSIYRSGVPDRLQHWRPGSVTLQQYRGTLVDQELAYHNRSTVEVPVEVWVYNFGRNALMKEVTFIDGRLTAITTLGYGK